MGAVLCEDVLIPKRIFPLGPIETLRASPRPDDQIAFLSKRTKDRADARVEERVLERILGDDSHGRRAAAKHADKDDFCVYQFEFGSVSASASMPAFCSMLMTR